MYLEKNKILIPAAFLITIICVVITTLSCTREKTATDKTEKAPIPSGPIIDLSKDKTPLLSPEMNSDDPKALARLGDRYFESKRFQEAIEVYEKVLKLNPKDIDTHNDLGLAYYYTGQSEMAITKLREGSEVMPGYQRIWLSLGFILKASGKVQEAKEPLRKAAELNPNTDVGLEAKKMLDLVIDSGDILFLED